MKKDKILYSPLSTPYIEPWEHIRLRPQWYFTTVFEEKNLNDLVLEVVQHAIDQTSTSITATIHADHFIVEFNTGMSLEMHEKYRGKVSQAEIFFTEITKTTEFWKKDILETGLKGSVGLIRINATSEWCTLLTYSDGQKGEFRFEKGATKTGSITKSQEQKNYTKITVKPDSTIFPDLTINPTTLQQEIDSIQEKINGVNIQLFIKT